MTQEENIAQLKEKFLEYYAELPIQKLAAASIGRNEDTITRWKSEDQDFADRVELAKADWAKKMVKGVKSKEWLLERIMKDNFSPRQEVTGEDGKPLVIIKDNGSSNGNQTVPVADPSLE